MLITLGRGMAPQSSNETSSFTLPEPMRPDYYVVLLAGQSNMAGRGTPIDAVLDASDPRIEQLSRTVATGADVTGETAILAADPLDHIGATSNSVGMGLSFAKQLLTIISANSKVLLVPVAQGATGFSGDDWNIGDPNYEDAITRANHAMTLGNNVFAGILWHQGEQDGGTSESIHTPRLDTLITTMRDRITGADNTTPFIVGDLVYSPTPNGVRTSLQNIKTRVPYTGFASSQGLTVMPDGVHFDPPAQRDFGSVRYWNEYNGGLSGDLTMSAPSAPTITATNDEDSQTTLTVSAGSLGGSAIRHILVRYRLAGDMTWTEFNRKADDTTTIIVGGLTNDSNYEFTTQIITSAGVSAESNIATAIPTAAMVPSGGARDPASTIATGAIIDLSARNSNSYDPAIDAQSWINLGAGADFHLGTNATVESSADPIFMGNAGENTAYFRFGSPNGRRFTAKSLMPEVDNIHRSDSTQGFTLMMQVKPMSTFRALFATGGHSTTPGSIFWHGAGKFRWRTYATSGQKSALEISFPTFDWTVTNILMFTYDPTTQTYKFKANNNAIVTGTHSVGTNTDASTTPATIMADVNGSFGFDLNGTILDDVIFYDRALSDTELNSFYTLLSTSKA